METQSDKARLHVGQGRAGREVGSDAAGPQARDAHLQVTFARSGVTARWDSSCTSLLELAEAHGLRPVHSCRLGLCLTCICALLEGEVEYFDHTVVEPEHGVVLLCSSRPLTDVVVDV